MYDYNYCRNGIEHIVDREGLTTSGPLVHDLDEVVML